VIYTYTGAVAYDTGAVAYEPDTNETSLSVQQRLDYLAACTLLDEAVLRYGTEKEKAA
jgi:hypothetical protein